jgi:peptidoglycan/LPS O-acetylase OafA/YrhL
VTGVILYHGGLGWAAGGFLGVEIFFVLSGYLITTLLIREWLERGTISLGAFWGRRARRLAPALVMLVVVVGVYYATVGSTRAVPGLLGDGLAALFYYSNWHQIAIGTSYFAASGPVSPFQHTWSLAIEEQFYVLWPLLVLAGAWAVRRAGASQRGCLRALLGVTLVGVVASATQAALAFAGGSGLDRVYYGTDTRATGLLAGAALALCLTLQRLRPRTSRRVGPRVPGAVITGSAWAGAVALLLLICGMHVADGSAAWLYPWGLLAVDLTTAAVILTAVTRPGSAVDRLLSLSPLRAAGRISYGLYLWHFPLFLWLDGDSTGLSGGRLFVLRVAVTVVVSTLSYVVVEQPIRRRRRPAWAYGVIAPLGAGGAVAALLAASAASAFSGTSAAIAGPAAAHAAAARFAGSGPACELTLSDEPGLGVAAVPLRSEQTFEYDALGDHNLVWHGSATQRFTTCPPKRMLVIGDSIAFTIGLPMLEDEQNYGAEVAVGAILGCAFATRGELSVNGVWQSPDTGCPSALATWAAEARSVNADEVVIELGYRDEFDWRWNGRVVHLGDPAFDAYVQAQIDDYVRVLGAGGRRVLFLTVPYTDPPAQRDGAPAPAASRTRHSLINAMIAKAAATDPGRASVLDIDRTISPQDRYTSTVNGRLCRFDGIHISLYCASLLETRILPAARRLIAR